MSAIAPVDRSRLRRALAIVLLLAVTACTAVPEATRRPADAAESPLPSASAAGLPPVTGPPPAPGHELYGFLPYWEMDDPGIAEHVASLPLTTLALFSVTHTPKGLINAKARGYPAITGDVGRGFIADAHGRGARVDLVYSSFGAGRNQRLLENAALQATVIANLVTLVGDLGVDGINVDIEALDPMLVPAFGGFVADLRAALAAADRGLTLSVATGGHGLGAAMAVAAAVAGADRVFLMGYDYRTGRSDPGASAPLDRRDGETADLRTSLELYGALGVPPDRLLLGLPLYGVDWPVAGPVIGAPSTGRGEAWFPRAHVELLTDADVVPERDAIEQVDVYFSASDGAVGAPDPSVGPSPGVVSPSLGPSPGASGDERTWRAVYVDTPGTLSPKLALANEHGLAGAGFWAVGYTRGLPAYTDLMDTFTKGEPLP